MDTNTTGNFIAERRKQKGLTQKDLSERLHVSNKAVSRWETGRGFPDTSLLKPLSDVLEVSVSELLSGKLIEEDTDVREQTDQIILDALRYSRRMLANMISLSDRGCYILGVVFLVVALVLEVLPIGVVMVFGTGSGKTIRETFSYFDLTPFGYGLFLLLPTGILTVVSVLLGIISGIRYNTVRKTKNAAFICSILVVALSLLHLLYGGYYMVAASYAVPAAIVISVCFQAVANRYKPDVTWCGCTQNEEGELSR